MAGPGGGRTAEIARAPEMTLKIPERRALTAARRIVVKIGSRLLAESPASRPATIADQVFALRERGIEIVIVSSGAIALGIRRL